MNSTDPARHVVQTTWKARLKAFYLRIKSLQGDPHYVAMGMATGVFISITPTIPFHMVLAVTMAFMLKGSKPAAIIGAWFCNPLTIGPIYVGSYKLGMWMLGRKVAIADLEHITFQQLLSLGTDVAVAMVIGGAVLGIIPAIATYAFTYRMFLRIRSRRKAKAMNALNPSPDASTDSDKTS